MNATEPRPTLQEMLQGTPPAEWVREKVEHYWRTGTFRPEDLRRLLGDPTKGIEVRPKNSLATFFTTCQHTSS